MNDRSMKAWLIRLFCDEPDHRSAQPGCADYEADWATKSAGLADARLAGWIIRRNGKLTCPECRP